MFKLTMILWISMKKIKDLMKISINSDQRLKNLKEDQLPLSLKVSMIWIPSKENSKSLKVLMDYLIDQSSKMNQKRNTLFYQKPINKT